MINTNDIAFAYNEQTRFQFPNLSCEAGQTLLVTGPSGTGKTTFLHLLGGLLAPTSGEIRIKGTDLAKIKGRRLDRFRGQHIGIVFQQAHFVASLSILENLELANWLSNGRKNTKKAQQLLEHLGIAAQAHKKPAQLSIGQQQRAAIARALMNDPQLLLADEPTSSLDDHNCRLVATLLEEQARDAKAALIVVTHDQRLKSLYTNQIDLL